MNSRSKIIIAGYVLIILGMILLFILKENEFGNFIGGGVLGIGGGFLSILFTSKKDKSNNQKA